MCVEGIGKINLVVQINGAGDTDIRAISSVINLLDRAFGQVGILAIKGVWRFNNVCRPCGMPVHSAPGVGGIKFPGQ